MKRLLVLSGLLLVLITASSLTGCQFTGSDPVEVIRVFKARPGTPVPTGGWGLASSDPYPDAVQVVFSPGEKMYLGLRISGRLKSDVTFAKYTFFNKGTGVEVVVAASPDDLGPLEPGSVVLLGFSDPWAIPTTAGSYEFRVYLGDRVVAAALFDIS
ncbi:MAG: hypothetical protein PHU08_06945 [Dehalococcoidales bacterium]|nr:hypothetical protein [Dehalococcoidales bacterium]